MPIEFSPSPLAFGQKNPGDETVLNLTVTNTELTGTYVVDSQYWQDYDNQLSVNLYNIDRLAPGESATVPVKLTCTRTGAISATLNLSMNKLIKNQPSPDDVLTASVVITANVVSSTDVLLSIVPNKLIFPNTQVGTESAEQSVVLSNISAAEILVELAELICNPSFRVKDINPYTEVTVLVDVPSGTVNGVPGLDTGITPPAKSLITYMHSKVFAKPGGTNFYSVRQGVNYFTNDAATTAGTESDGQAITPIATGESPENIYLEFDQPTTDDNGLIEITYRYVDCTLVQGSPFTVDIVFCPAVQGLIDEVQGLLIASDADSSPDYVELTGTSYIIIPVNPLTGQDDSCLFAFSGGDVLLADPEDLDCEEDLRLTKLLNFGEIGLDKTLERVYLDYEDKGEGTLELTGNVRDAWTPKRSKGVNMSYGTEEADDFPLRSTSSPIMVDGENIELILYKDHDTGPLSLIGFIFKYLLDLKQLGSWAYPTNVAFLQALQGVEGALFSFTDGTCKIADPDDLNCEDYQLLCKLYDYTIIGAEKALMNVWFKYEDMGAATAVLQLQSKRQVLDEVSVTFGTTENLRRVLQAFWDVTISEEVIRMAIIRGGGSGPMSMLEIIHQVEPKGRVIENL